MPKRRGTGRAPSKPAPAKTKPIISQGSSPLSPPKSADPSPGATAFSGADLASGSLAGSNGTPSVIIDEGMLQTITDDINDDVEMHLQEESDAPLLPGVEPGDDMDFDIDPLAADELLAQLQSDAIEEMAEDEGTVAVPEEEEDEDDDEEEEEDGEEDESNIAGPSTTPLHLPFRYPIPPSNFLTLSEREKAFKSARFIACQTPDCQCEEMVPPPGSQLEIMSRMELEEIMDRDEEDEGDEVRTGEGWWRVCGGCGHSWDEEGVGHTWPPGVSLEERNRRGKVVGRIEEFLNVSLASLGPAGLMGRITPY